MNGNRISLPKICVFLFILLLLMSNMRFSYLLISAQDINGSSNPDTKIVFSELSDGYSKYLGASTVDTWNDVHDSEIGNQRNDSCYYYSKGILAAYNSKEGDLYVISRSYFAFNTSFLGENATIVRADLYLYGIGTNESSVCMVSWDDGADGVDFDDYGFSGDENLGNTNQWFINEKGLAYVNKTGYTYVSCREYDHDFLNIAPEDNRLAEYRNGHYFSDEPGTDKDPYIFIEYYPDISVIDQDGDTPALPLSAFLVVLCIFLLCVQLNRWIRKENH